MSKNIALIFPGQGAQAVGMGRELAAAYPAAADLFRQADEILGWSLSKVCWEGPEEELTKTSVCQPALYVHGLAALAVVREKFGDLPVAGTAGLSLGEFTAHAAAGTFDFATGLRRAVEAADLVITGEGRLDEQTASGKAPAGVARLARACGKPVIALAGSVPLTKEDHGAFDAVLPIINESMTLDQAMQQAAPLLEEAAARAARLVRLGKLL